MQDLLRGMNDAKVKGRIKERAEDTFLDRPKPPPPPDSAGAAEDGFCSLESKSYTSDEVAASPTPPSGEAPSARVCKQRQRRGRPLNDEQLQALSESLRAKLGGKVSVEPSVDPSLIGGLVVKVGSRMIDASLKAKLQRLQYSMKGA